jgi:Protein of unknown function (DUF2690)
MKTALLAKVGLTAASSMAALIMSTTSAHAATARVADGSDPSATGCSAGAYTARSDVGSLGGEIHVLVELRYSPKCRTAWARVTTENMPACVPGEDWCGDAVVHRNGDGRSFTCDIPRGGHSCYTRQVNDAGVTSWAFGEGDDGAQTASADTASF